MRKLALAAAISLAAFSSAMGADPLLKIPKPAVTPGYPAVSGWFFGGWAEIGAGTANGVSAGTVDANTGKIFDASASAGLEVGHANCDPTGVRCFLFQGSVGFQNLNAQSQGLSFSGPLVFEELIIASTPAQNILQYIPKLNLFSNLQTPGVPLLPAGVTAGPAMIGLAFGSKQQDVSMQFMAEKLKAWEIALEVGIDTRWRLSDSNVAFVRTMYVAPSSSFCGVNGKFSACAGLGQGAYVKTGFDF